ncbi:MAG: LLM class flavin-dependent oxidoreductase [Actinobacteria bacterium]|nr:LLM class flavin-dependent oxidoreductase [Actinomycetota bacterium]
MTVPLSVLDLAPVPTGSTTRDALRASVALAQHVERLGFTRFWVAEHHGMPGVASSSPPVLIGAVAAATSSIRVGSGGVMLPNHRPLVVAEQFGMLEALHPGRIDLGLGRAPGSEPITSHAVRGSTDAGDFAQELAMLRAFFDDGFPTDHPYAAVRAVPAEGNVPAIHLLGSSGYSAQLAGQLGLPFAFAHHFSSKHTVPALELYRSSFRPSEVLERPYSIVCVSVLCAETAERARWLAGSGGLSWLRLRSGNPGTVPSPEEAAAFPYTEQQRAFVDERLADQVIGDVPTVRAGLAELQARTGADELMVTTSTFDPAERLRSFELLAS